MARPETHPIKKVIGFTAEMLEAVESWRAQQRPVPNLSEAIRRLVEIGLAHAPRPKSNRSKAAAKAKEMAGEQIDRMEDKSATTEERATRKQRLIEGPAPLREIRKKKS